MVNRIRPADRGPRSVAARPIPPSLPSQCDRSHHRLRSQRGRSLHWLRFPVCDGLIEYGWEFGVKVAGSFAGARFGPFAAVDGVGVLP